MKTYILPFVLLFGIIFQSCNTGETPVGTTMEATEGNIELTRVEPPFWWAGMKNSTVELMLHHENISDFEVKSGSNAVKIVSQANGDSKNYKFVTLDISNASVGQIPLILEKEGKSYLYNYELKARNLDPNKMAGVTAEDVIYLIFPDRFSNGDPSNDTIEGMQEQTNRSESLGRHGGDLQGIINHLDYLKDLGITAIWINPEIENNQPHESYHGYAATDFYKIDPRFGTNELYQTLVDKAHEKGIKVIKDIVHNHIGDQHWWMKDLPTKDWIHQFEEYTKTTYRATTLFDPYASEYDKTLMADGWFDVHMPDLNQKNEHLARYLIQNNIWWIEYAGLDGLRIDTYAYPDKDFTSKWCEAVLTEYPKIGMFGETWVHGVVTQAFFTDNNGLKSGHDTNLPGVTDFQLYYAINEALTKPQGWTDGVARIYYTLAKDIAFDDPMKNVTFLDNHDLSRFTSVVGENMNKFKSGIGFLLTMRGTPMLYYGTEIMMTSDDEPDHGYLRKDFPGGWTGDPQNKFVAQGRNAKEEEAFQFTQKMIQFRNQKKVLQTGKLMQFVPVNGLYAYFRYDEKDAVMVLMNTSNEAATVPTKPFVERFKGFSKAKNVETGTIIDNLSADLSIEANAILILELLK